MAGDFWIDEAQEADIPAITAILNHAAAHTTASWHEYPKTEAEMADWFAIRKRHYTVLAARDASGFLGYGSYGPFRGPSGYRLTAEHSLYVREDARGSGREEAAATRWAAQHPCCPGIPHRYSASHR